MIRIVAAILIGVQALLPPGMCPCQFVSVAAYKTPKPATALPITAHSDESCCSCRTCRPAAQTDTTPVGEQTVTDREVPHEHPLPAPASPCSGCPVVTAGPAARVAILPAPELDPLAAAAPFVVLTVEATPHRAERNAPATPTAPPLFVRHCALLI